MFTTRVTGTVLGTPIEVTTLDRACDRVIALAQQLRPAYVCFATAHMLVETSRDETVDRAYADADMVNPDGTPIAWCLRLLGHAGAGCVSGPRLMPILLKAAEAQGLSVGFYGGRPETLELMRATLEKTCPKLRIGYCCSPPFRPLDAGEQQDYLRQIAESGVHLLFVGLGSPKQERWMHEFSPSLNCVCLGVGAAFEFLSGEKILPPVWVQQLGLTWLVRLCQEPRRLARRNLYSPIFAVMFLRQLILGHKRKQHEPQRLAASAPGMRSPE
jgi:N-acetylglucosaminyldiphosphoundecaprenol N-acetyl-beta-D-mannosaminyltransferase